MPLPRPLHFLHARVPPHIRLLSASAFWILTLTIGTNDYLLEITPIYGRSMAPTLSPAYHATGAKDWLAWRKWKPTQDLQRGDIVMYHTPFKAEGSAVKRVIALGGDTIVLDARRRPGVVASGDGERLGLSDRDMELSRPDLPAAPYGQF